MGFYPWAFIFYPFSFRGLNHNMIDLSSLIKAVPDFPKPGILFRDITPLLAHPEGFQECIYQLARQVEQWQPQAIVGAESRGFIFGVPLALHLKIPFIPARKPGKLPREVQTASYSLEYGEDSLEIHKDDLHSGQRVLFVDDLLATGGTANASIRLIKSLNAEVVGCAFVIELEDLKGREHLDSVPCISLLKY